MNTLIRSFVVRDMAEFAREAQWIYPICGIRHADVSNVPESFFLGETRRLSAMPGLELRFAIEYITYDQLTAYIREVSGEALKKWTPKQVISELLEVDPEADCGADNWVAHHRVVPGAILVCEKCGIKATVEQRIGLVFEEDSSRTTEK
jgi:hypothetical protein